MKIGFISLPVFGHLNPMTALARELRSRQHDVVFISLLDTEPFVRGIASYLSYHVVKKICLQAQ